MAKKHKLKKWRSRFIFDVYEYAKQGMTDTAIKNALGIDFTTWKKWRERKPLLRMALKRARNGGDGRNQVQDFFQFVYGRLPEHLQMLWDEIEACEKEKNGIRRMEALLQKSGKRARQHLFVYALLSTNFNMSKACKKLNMPVKTVHSWIRFEPEFAELIDEIHFHKKEFVESALMQRIEEGSDACIIFANKALNRDRGYDIKKSVEISGTVNHQHQHMIVNVDELQIPLEMKRVLLDAVRDQRVKSLPPPEPDAVDAEFEVIQEGA